MDTEVTCEIPLETSDICRCCNSLLTCNIFKDISEERCFPSNIETYEAMLKETFNIQLSHYTHMSKQICPECIQKLHDADCFKKMIVNSEDRLRAQFQMMVEQKEPYDSESEWKIDPIKVEAFPLMDSLAGESDFIANSHGDSPGDDEILADVVAEMGKGSPHEQLHISDPHMTLRHRRKRRNDGEHIAKVKKKSSKNEKDWLKISERRGSGPILRGNSLKLISNSTLCVFQWHKSRYRCFCCQEPFSDMNQLRKHMETHSLEEIERKIIIQQNRLVKVETSFLLCKICDREMENLHALKLHLESHGITFVSPEDLLVPFRIESDLKCQICLEKFSVFRHLNIHMNKHFQKQVCHVCGAGFSNLVFLNLHRRRSHKPLDCTSCDLVFRSRKEKKEHDVSTHGVKFERKLRFPCPYCSERFFQENQRVLHLVAKHEMQKPAYKCIMCPKEFVTKSLCNNHVRIVHMKEKKHACDVCNSMFYTKSDVSRHKVTHSGEKNYSCDLCSNVFATKDSLRRHMKRTHGVV